MNNKKVIFDYKDLGLASYLILNGNSFEGINIKFSKRFNEFKIYIQICGYKNQLIKMNEYYEENKIQILKSENIKNKIDELTSEVKKKLKNEEE